MDKKTIQSSLDYLLTPEGQIFLVNELSKEKRQELINILNKVNKIKKLTTQKKYVGKE